MFPEVDILYMGMVGQVIHAACHNLSLQKLLIQTENIPSTNWTSAIVTGNLLLHYVEKLQVPA
jgi:hypothetical protein